MPDKSLRTKSQLKALFTNLTRKGITDDMMAILIDVVWRNEPIMRTSGFELAGGIDSVFSWNDASRTFSIIPLDPVYAGYIPKYSIFSWSNQTHQHTKFEREELILPDEEGLFAIYFAADSVLRTQTLHYLKNPTRSDLQVLYLKKVLISFVYWDATNKTAIHAGNDRHGSEWNPQQHWQQHRAFQAKKDSGMSITGILVNEDGSDDSHAKFNVSAGQMWHDDFLIDIPEVIANATIPILYFSTGNVPRFALQTGFGILHGTNRIQYNLNSLSTTDATNGYIIAYHIFATNEHFIESRKVISVMGQNQYVNLAAAYLEVNRELDAIFQYMPAQGRCHLGTIFFQTDDAYTNTPHARIVGFIGDTAKTHLPVTVTESSKQYLQVNDDQELAFNPGITVAQNNHGFSIGNAIRLNGSTYVKAQADNSSNAQTVGIVTGIIDIHTFRFQTGGFLQDPQFVSGDEYFLSTATPGELITLSDPEVWNIGEVRQSLGWGTPQGLNIEIDIGDEISAAAIVSGSGLTIAIDDEIPMTGEKVWYQPSTATLSILIDAQWVAVSKIGIDGISAYESWLNVGNEGTEQDFVNSLTGKSAFEIWLLIGNVGTEADFILSLKGETGFSAYEIWLNLGNTGTEQDFIDYLMTGQSAYDIWISEGNIGTEADFLLSLKGLKGDKGNTGSTGDSAYVYIAYASDANGTDFTTTFNPSLNYIAFRSISVWYSTPPASLFTGLWKNLNSSLWKENGSTLEPVDNTKTVTAANFVLSSERKLKENINPISDLKKFDSIEFREYVLKSDKEQRLRYGVVVDEIESIAPELIYVSPDGKKTVAYIDLLIAKTARLEEEIMKLKTRL